MKKLVAIGIIILGATLAAILEYKGIKDPCLFCFFMGFVIAIIADKVWEY